MRRCQITHMNIISNASTVRRIVVRPINDDVWAKSYGYCQGQWNQMGLGVVLFTDLTVRVCARSIEIAQTNRTHPIRYSEVS